MPALLMLLALLGGGALIYSAERPQTWPAAQRGLAVAKMWCADCHQIAADAPKPAVAGTPPPGFVQIARRKNGDAAWLRSFLGEQHLPMPTFRLTDAEKDDVLAYFAALRVER